MHQIPFLNLKSQYDSIKSEIDLAIQSVINESAFVKGRYVESFENNFSKYIGARNSIGVANGTDAIFIALKCLGIGTGDEVIVPANSFIATSEAVSLTGATPIFVDCESKTYNIDCAKIEEKITPKTKVIIPVHLYGQPADMEKIMAISTKHNLIVVEDSAQAHGAEYNGKKVGLFGICATFSFYPGKNLGAYGDGGAIVTNDDLLAEKMRMFANHGRKDKYDHKFEGINSRLDGLQAAILDVKLRHLDDWTKKRIKIADTYNKSLDGVVITPKIVEGVKHVYHLYVVRVSDRDKFREILKNDGVETGVHYPIPLPLLEAYSKFGKKPEDFPKASDFANHIVSLPLYENLTDEEIGYVIQVVIKAIGGQYK